MKLRLALFLAIALTGASAARADGINPIETRQAGQDLFAAAYAGIRVVVATKGDVKTLESPAKAMAR